MNRSTAFALLFTALLTSSHAQEIQFTSIPDGYRARSISLPRGFAGALAADPANDAFVYASIGDYGDNDLSRINLYTGSIQILAHSQFKALNGIAVLSPTKIICVDNFGSNAGPPNDTILLASDDNADGDFDDSGEITQLISPLGIDSLYGFTGAQARVAPANQSGIPTGAVVVQTANGAANGELLAISDPLQTPHYVPSGNAFYTGFDYNGGFDFAPLSGKLILGEQTQFVGSIHSIHDADQNGIIAPEEDTILATGEASLIDVAVDSTDTIFITSWKETMIGAIRQVEESGNVTNFAITDSAYLTGLLFNSKSRSFESDSGIGGAVLVTGGWTSDFGATAKNLLTLTPDGPSAAKSWREYR